MKKIKLFENFESFEDIDDVLVSLIDKGILKIKNKPFFTYEENYDDDDNPGGIPQISTRYYITKDLGKIDSIEKMDSLVQLLSEFKQAIYRLDQYSSYMIDLGAKELEIKLSVPDNIKDIFDRVSIDVHGESYLYDEDIDGIPYTVKLDFKVDEHLKIIIFVKIRSKGVVHTIEDLQEPIIEHFNGYGLKFIQMKDNVGTWIWEFISE